MSLLLQCGKHTMHNIVSKVKKYYMIMLSIFLGLLINIFSCLYCLRTGGMQVLCDESCTKLCLHEGQLWEEIFSMATWS